MNKVTKFILATLVGAIFFGVIGFFIWVQDTAGPAQEALAALESDENVVVEKKDKLIIFKPVDNPNPLTGFIFYPGGKVIAESYAPPLRMIAEAGYLVVLVPVRYNLAFFDINAAKPVLQMFPDIKHWAIGGHSLGGVAAATFANNHKQIQGIVFWGSYPPNDALKDSQLIVTSIYGTNDGLTTLEKIEESKALLPSTATFVAIEGGNHAQFGAYGPQDGDNPADILAIRQWQQVAGATVQLLAQLKLLPEITNDTQAFPLTPADSSLFTPMPPAQPYPSYP